MRALVLGGTGMLGTAVTTLWRRRQQAVLALERTRADISNRQQLCDWVTAFSPEVVINCAAFTRVDDCETERQHAMDINGTAVANVVAAAQQADAPLVHISSDYVFDGAAETPYVEDHETGPRSAYGASKLLGETEALKYERSLVIRASWLFGPGGPNFVATMCRLMNRENPSVRVVEDQVGCPTYTPYLARAIWDLLEADLTGVVHYCNRDAVSWHGFAQEIARFVAPTAEVLPIPTSEFPRPASRPAYSVLATRRFEATVGRRVEPWAAGLATYLQ
ncbi:MAG: dTDP-4-dehydrorhamnose reductase [Acidobacteriota bacterium]